MKTSEESVTRIKTQHATSYMDDRSIVFVNAKKDPNTAPKWTKVCIFAFPFDQCDQILCGRKFYPNMLCVCT